MVKSPNLDHTNLPLGKQIANSKILMPTILCAITRDTSFRTHPIFGQDIWNAYELSWLNADHLPQVAVLRFIVPLTSPYIVESKSLKLYLNSYNFTVFKSAADVLTQLQNDLTAIIRSPLKMTLNPSDVSNDMLDFDLGQAKKLDDLKIKYKCNVTTQEAVSSNILQWSKPHVLADEQWQTHLFRSNCPVTGQPDWATLDVAYKGKAWNPETLLSYFLSYRDHAAFHESCIDRCFQDIMTELKPESLTLVARFLRRGGIDINPIRTSDPSMMPKWCRLMRQ